MYPCSNLLSNSLVLVYFHNFCNCNFIVPIFCDRISREVRLLRPEAESLPLTRTDWACYGWMLCASEPPNTFFPSKK